LPCTRPALLLGDQLTLPWEQRWSAEVQSKLHSHDNALPPLPKHPQTSSETLQSTAVMVTSEAPRRGPPAPRPPVAELLGALPAKCPAPGRPYKTARMHSRRPTPAAATAALGRRHGDADSLHLLADLADGDGRGRDGDERGRDGRALRRHINAPGVHVDERLRARHLPRQPHGDVRLNATCRACVRMQSCRSRGLLTGWMLTAQGHTGACTSTCQ